MLRRLGCALPAVVVALGLTWVLLDALPGDVCETFRPPDMDSDAYAAMRTAWGCDTTGLARLLGLRGALLAAPTEVGPALSASLALTVPALVFANLGGLVLGAAQAGDSRRDRVLTLLASFGWSVPLFLVAYLARELVTATHLPLPILARSPVGDTGVVDAIHRALLPILVLSVPLLVHHARYYRAVFAVERHRPHLRAARARGLPPGRIRVHHLARNLLPTVCTRVGLDFAWLVPGAVLVERAFWFPGAGLLLVDAAGEPRMAVVLTIVAAAATFTALGAALGEGAAALVDPRLRT